MLQLIDFEKKEKDSFPLSLSRSSKRRRKNKKKKTTTRMLIGKSFLWD